jgi:Predicted glycosyltransferases
MSDFLIPNASVIIVSFNTKNVLRDCLHSLYAASLVKLVEVIVVDNASHDGSADMIEAEFPNVRLLRSTTNLGFAAANNLAFKIATGRYFVLLNPDAQLEVDALQKSLLFMTMTPRAGLAGGRLLSPEGEEQPSARQFPSLLNELIVISGLAARYPHSRFFGRFDRTWANTQEPATVDWVPGAYAIIRREALDQIGYFDERFFLYYEEVDLCRRIKEAGWEIWYRPEIVIRHIGGESSKTVEKTEFSSSGSQLVLWRMRSALLYYRKHHGWLAAWLLNKLETSWHSLRMIKARITGKSSSAERKVQESHRLVALMRQAWGETQGGSSSPHRPW